MAKHILQALLYVAITDAPYLWANGLAGFARTAMAKKLKLKRRINK